MLRKVSASRFINTNALRPFGLTAEMIAAGINHTYNILDTIDERLLHAEEERLAKLFELANLSAMVGNLLRAGIAKASGGRFERNKPHKYPDLIPTVRGCSEIEIKVALEDNKPKGHLAKPGPHLTFRYVLGDADGGFVSGTSSRGDVVWIWEARVGDLDLSHFNLSNTSGDSGKTAVINAEGMKTLIPIYCGLNHCPHPKGGRLYQSYQKLLGVQVRPT